MDVKSVLTPTLGQKEKISRDWFEQNERNDAKYELIHGEAVTKQFTAKVHGLFFDRNTSSGNSSGDWIDRSGFRGLC
jgi:hypothetical protein